MATASNGTKWLSRRRRGNKCVSGEYGCVRMAPWSDSPSGWRVWSVAVYGLDCQVTLSLPFKVVPWPAIALSVALVPVANRFITIMQSHLHRSCLRHGADAITRSSCAHRWTKRPKSDCLQAKIQVIWLLCQVGCTSRNHLLQPLSDLWMLAVVLCGTRSFIEFNQLVMYNYAPTANLKAPSGLYRNDSLSTC